MAIEIREVAYHLNGKEGQPFYAVLFNDTGYGMFNQLATIGEGGTDCRVINAGLVVTGGHVGQRVGMNKWNGHLYLDEIALALSNDPKWHNWYRSIFQVEESHDS